MKKETIETSTSMKQIYKYHFAKYNLGEFDDSVYSLYKICRHLMSDKNINNLKKVLDKNYDVVMKRFRAFLPKYELASQYRQMIMETKSIKEKEYYKDELKKECYSLPAINEAIILVFELLVLRTDLKNVPMLSPQVIDTDSNKMPMSFQSDEENY